MPPTQVTFASDEEYASGVTSPLSHPDRLPPTLARAYTSPLVHAIEDGIIGQYTRSPTQMSERTALLTAAVGEIGKKYTDTSRSSPRSKSLSRTNSAIGSFGFGRHSRRTSNWWDVPSPVFGRSGLRTPRLGRSLVLDTSSTNERLWYDQFTSTDWVYDGVADGYRALQLRKYKGLRARLWLLFDAVQGWILVALIGFVTAVIAYLVDISEAAVFDLKRGYCTKAWYFSQAKCCRHRHDCKDWLTWSELLSINGSEHPVNYIFFIMGCIVFAMIAWFMTNFSKTTVPLQIASTFDENLGADRRKESTASLGSRDAPHTASESKPAVMYYSAAGSGVAEVKVILSGFVLHGYLGFKTLLIKCPALVFSVASGMSLGKEGPYVHIATCVGNIASRLFSKYSLNDGKRREVMSAAAAAGLAVAFGSPIGGVLFSLEEVSYYFPPKTLFRTFFCCIVAALSLKFLNPYGTNKIVIFEVRYVTDWHTFELLAFALLGIVGGLAGAGFIKASRFWATTVRRWKFIKSNTGLEVLLVALITGLVSYWNRHSTLPVAELLLELASPCNPENQSGFCPKSERHIPQVIGYLIIVFVIKAFLTVITFGIKVPAGIYVPSMVCGGIMGRIVGHTIQYAVLSLPDSWTSSHCSAGNNLEECVTPGVYALVAAGATMCGVTRLTVTLAVVLFELTGSLDHVLPFAIGVLTAKWTADFIEPHSIYDLLIDMNSYPYMDNRYMPLFDVDAKLDDITSRPRSERVIDISISPYVRASELRTKLNVLHSVGELDGGLPIIREKVLVGLVPVPDLEFALDRIETPEDNTLCLMSEVDGFAHKTNRKRWFAVVNDVTPENERTSSASISVSSQSSEHDQERSTFEADLIPFIDPAPVSLEAQSPMNLVYQCFSKLGLRYICVVDEGQYRGMVHKKSFVKYLKTYKGKHES